MSDTRLEAAKDFLAKVDPGGPHDRSWYGDTARLAVELDACLRAESANVAMLAKRLAKTEDHAAGLMRHLHMLVHGAKTLLACQHDPLVFCGCNAILEAAVAGAERDGA